MREELGIEVRPVERLPDRWSLKPGYVLEVWTATLVSGEPRPLQDHDEVRWLTPDRLDDVDWLEADRPAVVEAGRAWIHAPGT